MVRPEEIKGGLSKLGSQSQLLHHWQTFTLLPSPPSINPSIFPLNVSPICHFPISLSPSLHLLISDISSTFMLGHFSHIRLFATPWSAAHKASLGLNMSQSLPKFMSIASLMPSNHLILWCPFSFCPLSPWSFSASGTFPMSWLFSSGDQNTGASDSASVLPIFRTDFFKIDWFDLTVQGTLRSLFQHHSLKASVLQHSAFFVVELLQLYMTTGKTIILTIWTFISKVMCLLFNTA